MERQVEASRADGLPRATNSGLYNEEISVCRSPKHTAYCSPRFNQHSVVIREGVTTTSELSDF